MKTARAIAPLPARALSAVPLRDADGSTGALRGTLLGHSQGVRRLAFRPGGALLSGAHNGMVIWDVARQAELKMIEAPGGTLLAGTLVVWQVES